MLSAERGSVSLKYFVIGLSFISLAYAAVPELAVKKFVQEKYFKGAETTLNVLEDKSIPFASARLYRVRPMRGEGGWTILVDANGKSVEANKTSLKSFLKSLESGLAKVKFSDDSNEAVKISNGLLNHLSTGRRNVHCSDGKTQKKCELSFSEGNFSGQKSSLVFDLKSGSIKVL